MKLDFKLREDSGSRKSNRLRNEGQIPAVIYGNGFDTHNIILDEKELQQVLKSLGENAVINLDIDGKEETAMIKDIQRTPIGHYVTHVDLQQVDAKEKMQVEVPVSLVGKEYGIEGAVLQQQLDTVLVECLAINIPRSIVVDIDDMEIGDSMLVSELYENEDYEILTEDNEVVASIIESTLDFEELEDLEDVDAADVPEIDAEEDEESEESEESEEE